MKFSLFKIQGAGAPIRTMKKNKFDQNMLKIFLFNFFVLTIMI